MCLIYLSTLSVKFVGLLQYKFLLQSNKFLHKISAIQIVAANLLGCCNTNFCCNPTNFYNTNFCNKFLEKKFLQQISAITISVANFYCIFLQFHCMQSQFYCIFLLHTVTTHSTQHTITTHKFLLHINSTNTYIKHSNNSQFSRFCN